MTWLQRVLGIDLRALACFRVGIAAIIVLDLLSRSRDLAALVLWAPFVSVGHMALRRYGLPPILAKDRYDTRAALAEFDGPVLIFHGRTDPVIPFSNGELLAAEADNARLVRWDCDHNDCPPAWPDLWEPLTAFLMEHDLTGRGRAGLAPGR